MVEGISREQVRGLLRANGGTVSDSAAAAATAAVNAANAAAASADAAVDDEADLAVDDEPGSEVEGDAARDDGETSAPRASCEFSCTGRSVRRSFNHLWLWYSLHSHKVSKWIASQLPASREARAGAEAAGSRTWRDACKFACNNCSVETSSRNELAYFLQDFLFKCF